MKIAAMNAHMGSQKDLNNPDTIYEPKLDGIRALCYVNKEVQFISRNDIDLTQRFSGLKNDVRVAAKSCILDGEIIAYDTHGNPNFTSLQTGSTTNYIVFDILMKDGKSLVHLPLHERKKILEKTVVDTNTIKKIVFTIDGKKLWKLMLKHKMEGVMAKLINSHYYPGKRSKVWLKVKFTNTLDAVIVGYTVGRRAIASLALAVYNNDKLQYIGNVGTGFSEELIKDLHKQLLPLETNKKPVPEVPGKDIIWVKPKLVCEIKFAEFTRFTIMRSPVFLRLRFDKKPRQCTLKDQAPTVKK